MIFIDICCSSTVRFSSKQAFLTICFSFRLSINISDTSISRSRLLESAVPPSKISALSSGEFVGMVADDPDCKIDLKTFHCEIINDHEALKKEQDSYKDIQDIIQSEMERLLNDLGLKHLAVRKG